MPNQRANNLYQVPDVINPPDKLCFTMKIPNEPTHIANLNGALFSLCAARAYMDKPGVRALDIANVWRRLMETIEITDCAGNVVSLPLQGWESDVDICESLRYHNGKLQGFCCGSWQDIGSDDGTAPTGGAGQPGGGQPQPQPGGGQQCYDVQFNANSQGNVPTIVNSGDVIVLQSATGAGSFPGDLHWYCVNGQVFFAGGCTGTPLITGTDPLGTAPRGKMIFSVNGVFYEATIGTPITIPGGVTNAPIYIQANGTLAGASGSYKVSVCVTNNTAATWTHHFGFQLSDGGWILDPAVGACPGQYIPGTGWQSLDGDCVGASAGYLTFLKHFAATITNIRVIYSVAGAGWSGDMDDGSIALGILDTTVGSHDLSFPGLHVITDHVRFALTTTTTGGTIICTDIYISGTGTNPF